MSMWGVNIVIPAPVRMGNVMRSSLSTLRKIAAVRHPVGVWRDRDGVAAIEFAMIVPLMFMLFVGAVEFSQAITVDRRVTQIASSTADLVARTKSISSSEVDSIFKISDELMKPYETAPLKISILNVIASPSDATDTTVCWFQNYQGGAATYTKGQKYNLPTGVVQAGESVIVAEVRYAYTPPLFQYFMKGTTDLSETFYLKPRLSASIDKDGVKCL